MREEDLIQRLLQAEAAHLAALACNRLLVAAAGLFACIALLLSGALGFVLGQLSSSNHESKSSERILVNADPPGKDPAGQSLQELAQNLPHVCTGPSPAQPVSSNPPQDGNAHQVSADGSRAGQHGSAALSLNSGPELLKAVHETYISQWHNNEPPWKEPQAGRDSRLSSRIPSYTSEASEQLMWTSSLRPGSWHELSVSNSNAAVFGTQLLYADWELTQGQIKFCYDSSGAIVCLDNNEGNSQIKLYKAVLDGKLEVAVRTLKLSRDAFTDQKLTELALQQQLLNSAPQLIHFYGSSRTEDAVMLVYEYVQGVELREAIRRNPAALAWYTGGKAVARDVAQGLAYLHKLGVEHRSFKTGRVLVRSTDGSAKIADAGLQAATRYCQQSRSKRLVAAFEWASPELLLGDKCGAEADIFGLGVTLWELVTQEMPIRGALRDVRVPEECPASIKALISRCMAREPEMRPTAEEVVATIQRVWNASSASTRKPNEDLTGRPLLVSRRSLRGTQSQPVTPSFRPPREGSTRSACDSVSEMVDLRRRQPVRKGTVLSSQFAGTSGKPPQSPHSSPEMYRRTLSPGGQRSGSLTNFSEEAFKPRLTLPHSGFSGSTSYSKRPSPFERYTPKGLKPIPDAELRRQQERLMRERKKRAHGLHGAHSAPSPERARPISKQGEALKALPILTASTFQQQLARACNDSAKPSDELGASLASELSLIDVVEAKRELPDTIDEASERPAGSDFLISAPTLRTLLIQPAEFAECNTQAPDEGPASPLLKPPAPHLTQVPEGTKQADDSCKDALERLGKPDLPGGQPLPQTEQQSGNKREQSGGSGPGSSVLLQSRPDAAALEAAEIQLDQKGDKNASARSEATDPSQHALQEKWRLFRDVTFSHWLGREVVADKESTPPNFSRIASFTRFPSLRRLRSSKEPQGATLDAAEGQSQEPGAA